MPQVACCQKFQNFLKKLILKKINKDISSWLDRWSSVWILIQHLHWMVALLNVYNQYSIWKQAYCTTAFLDIHQAFDKVWQTWIAIQGQDNASYLTYWNLTQRQIQNESNRDGSRYFCVHLDSTAAIPTTKAATIGTFSDDMNIFSISKWHCKLSCKIFRTPEPKLEMVKKEQNQKQ